MDLEVVREMRRVIRVLCACFLVALFFPASALSFSATVTEKAQGTGSAPVDAFIICNNISNYSLIHSGVVFSGETNCNGFLMTSLYGKASIVNTATGNQASCNSCTDVKSSGSATLVAGFPYTLRYETTLQVPPGYNWVLIPPGCTRPSFPILSCTFNYNFTAI